MVLLASTSRVCMMKFLEIGDKPELAIADWRNKIVQIMNEFSLIFFSLGFLKGAEKRP